MINSIGPENLIEDLGTSDSASAQTVEELKTSLTDWLAPLTAAAHDSIGARITLDRKIDALILTAEARGRQSLVELSKICDKHDYAFWPDIDYMDRGEIG